MLVELRCRDWLDSIPHFSGAWNEQRLDLSSDGSYRCRERDGATGRAGKAWRKVAGGKEQVGLETTAHTSALLYAKIYHDTGEICSFCHNCHRLGCSAAVCWWQRCGFVENWGVSLLVDHREVCCSESGSQTFIYRWWTRSRGRMLYEQRGSLGSPIRPVGCADTSS